MNKVISAKYVSFQIYLGFFFCVLGIPYIAFGQMPITAHDKAEIVQATNMFF